MIVYVLHFSKPLHHARHYIGTTINFKRRMALHRAGRGAKILKRALELGITWKVVYKTWGGRKLERNLKQRKDAATLCPVCKKARLKRKMGTQRRRRQIAREVRARWQ
jgi:predicted GIY-YIG superfamily endonuclease